MNKDVKTLVIAVLTLMVYALGIFITYGTFLFPIPLNPFIFFLVALIFVYRHGKKRKKRITAIIVLLVGIFGVLSSGVLWDLLLSIEAIEKLFPQNKAQWLKVIYGVLVFIWGTSTLLNRRRTLPILLTVTGMGLFCLGFFGVYDPYNIFIMIGFALVVLSNFIKPVQRPFHLLWILLLFLEVSEWVTLHLA